MINKQKIWFLTLFSIILVLSVYYIALPNTSLSSLIESKETTSNQKEVVIKEEDSLSALRIEDDELVLAQMKELQDVMLNKESNIEDKNNAYEKMQSINLNKGKEESLEQLILKTYNIKSFIKIRDDQINVTIASKDNSYQSANNIMRTIQNEYKEKKYITVKYQ